MYLVAVIGVADLEQVRREVSYDGGGGDDEWGRSQVRWNEGRLCVGPFFWRFPRVFVPN